VGPLVAERGRGQLLEVLDPADRDQGVGPQVGADYERLVLVVADHADAGGAFELVQVVLELAAKLGVGDVLDETGQPLAVAHDQAAPPGAQMAVVVGPVEEVGHAILLRSHAKESAHVVPSNCAGRDG